MTSFATAGDGFGLSQKSLKAGLTHIKQGCRALQAPRKSIRQMFVMPAAFNGAGA